MFFLIHDFLAGVFSSSSEVEEYIRQFSTKRKLRVLVPHGCIPQFPPYFQKTTETFLIHTIISFNAYFRDQLKLIYFQIRF